MYADTEILYIIKKKKCQPFRSHSSKNSTIARVISRYGEHETKFRNENTYTTVFQFDGDDGYVQLAYYVSFDQPRACPTGAIHVWRLSGQCALVSAEKLVRNFKKSRVKTRINFLQKLYDPRTDKEDLVARFLKK